jgi:hypothetical protein
MKILIACETSGTISNAMRANGHEVWTNDILPCQDPARDAPWHLQCDVFDILAQDWDLVIAHPPCTYLSSSGQRWHKTQPGRGLLMMNAVAFVAALRDATAHVPMVAIENPIGRLSTLYCKPDQIIQPYQFGDDASKSTCLWLKGLPFLRGTKDIAPRIIEYKGKPAKRWANQSPCGAQSLPPSANRWQIRSNTYPGIAQAMARQWAPIEPLEDTLEECSECGDLVGLCACFEYCRCGKATYECDC